MDTADRLSAGLLALALLALVLVAFWRSIRRRQLSSLYYLSLLSILAGPALIDVFVGFSNSSTTSLWGRYFPNAVAGIVPALIFALAHTATTVLLQGIRSSTKRRSAVLALIDTSAETIVNGVTGARVFGALYIGSCVAIVWTRGDLTRVWNDFLTLDNQHAYYVYAYFASTPLAAIVLRRYGLKHLTTFALVASSVVASYCLAIRYYMFPFVGFIVYYSVLKRRSRSRRRYVVLVSAWATGWLLLTFWGVVRDYGLRSAPLSVFAVIDGPSLRQRLIEGNEYATRLAYYQLVETLQDEPAGISYEPVVNTIVDGIYPVIQRSLGIQPPVSTSMHIYESLFRVYGSGVSIGATIYGYDWFNWRWNGALLGGLLMGLALRFIDRLQASYPSIFVMLAPMLTYQLMFWVRGGVDFTLGLWTRSGPISLVSCTFVCMIEARRFKRLRQ